MFLQQHIKANNKGSIKASHHWASVGGIHRSTVSSPYKEPLMREYKKMAGIRIKLSHLIARAILILDCSDQF